MEQGNVLRGAFREVQRVTGSVGGFVLGVVEDTFNGHQHLQRIQGESRERKLVEDDVVIDLRDRTEAFDRRDEIEASKHRHPAMRGW